jgi:hypothetical protein
MGPLTPGPKPVHWDLETTPEGNIKRTKCQDYIDELKRQFREDLLYCRGLYGMELIEYLVNLEDKYD